jgi:phosphate-selective porin OprO/OprP
LGRDLPWRQTDVEYTEKPTGSLAFAGATHKGRCTRWSSSGCGNLDGFAKPKDAMNAQFEIDQYMQEFAFKWRGFSAQQEYHWKDVTDLTAGTKSKLTGGYAQAGYFFHHVFPIVSPKLEFAMRYASVDEPNAVDRTLENGREEYSFAANYFFNGHNNKLTLDYSDLSIDDPELGEHASDGRIRLQWDVSF